MHQGFNCTQIFGPPMASVDPPLAQKLFERFNTLATMYLATDFRQM